jgi:hypothetical protein
VAFTYKWQELIGLVSKLVKGVPVDWLMYCDLVSSDMYTSFPWRDALQNIAAGQIPLVDGVQDYSVPTNIYRLTKASIARTDQQPEYNRELNVETDLDVDLVPRGYPSIRACSLQAGVGQLRLDSAVQVPTGILLELRGEYQISSPKVSSLTDTLWFQDHYSYVAIKGLLYWGYLMTNDSRAGTTATDDNGNARYSGQLAEYKAALATMREREQWGAGETYYPSESMGADRYGSGSFPNIFGGN